MLTNALRRAKIKGYVGILAISWWKCHHQTEGLMVYPRHLADVLRRRLKSSPVLLLIGPRQAGKTTLTQMLGNEIGMSYTSMDDIAALAVVQFDPIGYIKELVKPVIIDEAQRAPELFLPIKVDVDNNRHPGRYLLTGSANPLLAPHLGDSLTGRMGICNLWPMSQGELLGVRETFIDNLFAEEMQWGDFPRFDKDKLIRRLFLGGFPFMQTATTEEQRRNWCNDYLFSSLQKDINDLSKIEGFSQMPALLYGLAARVGSTLNTEELHRITGASSTTLRRYMQLLENLFLLYRLPAWSPNIDKRLLKSPKVYFSDTALLLHMLNLDEGRLGAIPQLLGHIAENFVVMECIKQSTWSQTTPQLYHYRQEKEKGTEVDLVMVNRSGKIIGIEIKMAAIVRKNDLKGLNSLKEHSGDDFHRGIVLYMGEKKLPLGDRMHALPLSALWTN